jgi:uncharacterized protein (DUF2132 family)
MSAPIEPETQLAAPAKPPAETSSPTTTPDASPRKVDPLHGITLEAILTKLVAHYGWDELGDRVRVNCFVSDPSIKSSLKFLRKTPWARQKVEALYVSSLDLLEQLEQQPEQPEQRQQPEQPQQPEH